MKPVKTLFKGMKMGIPTDEEGWDDILLNDKDKEPITQMYTDSD